MMRTIRNRLGWTFAALILAAAPARADLVTVDFEDLALSAGSYVSNPTGFAALGTKDTTFSSRGATFNNSVTNEDFFGTRYFSWSGWAYSNVDDTSDPAFTNQYAAITGKGAGGGGNYGVAYAGGLNDAWIDLPDGSSAVSMLVTNTTYAYLTMLNGDPYGFSKVFTTGDFFRLTITGYDDLHATGGAVGSTTVDLANYSSPTDTPLNYWKSIDLSGFVGAKSLGFALESSDNDPIFGMNTPAYFAMDSLVVSTPSVPEPSGLVLAASGMAAAVLLVRRRKAD